MSIEFVERMDHISSLFTKIQQSTNNLNLFRFNQFNNNNYTHGTTPSSKFVVCGIILLFIVIILSISWYYYNYLLKLSQVVQELYGYAVIDKKRYYYASPKAITTNEIRGESCCGITNVPLTSIRAVSLHPVIFPTRSSSFGFTIRMWLYLRQSNYQRYGMLQEQLHSYLDTIQTPRMGIITYGPLGIPGVSDEQIIRDPFQLLIQSYDWTLRVPFGIYLDRTKNKIWVILDRSRTSEQPLRAYIEDVPLDTFFQLSVVVTPQRMEVYIDGELLDGWSQQNGYSIPESSNWLLYDNVRRNKSHTTDNGKTYQLLEQVGFQGRIAFLEMKSSSLTPLQIRSRYSEEKKFI